MYNPAGSGAVADPGGPSAVVAPPRRAHESGDIVYRVATGLHTEPAHPRLASATKPNVADIVAGSDSVKLPRFALTTPHPQAEETPPVSPPGTLGPPTGDARLNAPQSLGHAIAQSRSQSDSGILVEAQGYTLMPHSTPVSPVPGREEVTPSKASSSTNDSLIDSPSPQSSGAAYNVTIDGPGSLHPVRSAVQQHEPTEDPSKLTSLPRPKRPVLQRFYSLPETPTISPARHHFRLPNAGPKYVKLTPSIKYAEDARGKFINQYLVQRVAGRGTFGMVYKVIDPSTNVVYAVKEYSKMQLLKANRRLLMSARRQGRPMLANASQLIGEEVAIMKRIDHPNLVNLHEFLDDESTDKLYMVIEWCENGSIMPTESEYDGKATPLDEEQCRLYFRDMILGLEYLHSQGITHRDIKADNVLLGEDDVLKLADFGVSEMFDTPENDTIRKCSGSPAYWAPELAILSGGGDALIASQQLNNVSGRRTDIWAMGVTLFYMHHGWLPFEAQTLQDLYSQILQSDPVVKDDTSPELKDLYSRLLEKSANKRISMEELRNHPWVTRGSTDKLLTRDENTSNKMDPITEDQLKSAIEKIRQNYSDDPFDFHLASQSLRRDHGWRGTGSVSPQPSQHNSEDGAPESESGDGATRQSSEEKTPSSVGPEPNDNVKIDKLMLALDEIMRKMRWNRRQEHEP